MLIFEDEDDEDVDNGIGGDEPFCEHGNLLWSEDCNECDDALLRISNAINAAEQAKKES